MWCPDCEEMEVNLKNVLQYRDLDSITTPDNSTHREDQPAADPSETERSGGPPPLILVYVYVGDREQ
jgi:hypothetical protein